MGPEGLAGEALWLARLLCDLMPVELEPKGLLALMLYCTARAAARRKEGAFVTQTEQDPSLRERTMITEAEGHLIRAAQSARFGRFQGEAAIQSVHVRRAATCVLNLKAPGMLRDLLVSRTGSIGALVGRAVVMADAGQPEAALLVLDAIDPDRIADHQPWWVARAHAARRAGTLKRRRVT